MRRIEPSEAITHLKKMPFSKSWQNVFVTKVKRVLNKESNTFEDVELEDFIYIPAPSIVRYFGSNKEFLQFRSENKNSKDWDYKLFGDPAENNNRRLAIMYIEHFLNALDIKFIIDDAYTLYIMDSELQKLSNSEVAGAKDFIRNLYIPRTITQKKGGSETWGY